MGDSSRDGDQAGRSLRGFLRFFGGLVVLCGLVLTVVGAISMISASKVIGGAHYFWAAYLGLPLIALGSAIFQADRLGADSNASAADTTPGTTAREPSGAAPVSCAGCGATNLAHARFCDRCGTALAVKTCADCGATITSNARFCNQCGKSIG
jgi:hypothetical protein